LIGYAVAHLATQFRSHVFSVLVVKDYARLIRWDRAGAVVTAAFDYCDPESLLIEFFQRYELLGPEARGVDTSVEEPSAAEAAAARELLMLEPPVPLVKLAVPSSKTKELAYYVGPMPTAMRNASPTGRSTRIFIAYDIHEKRKVFLKDTWRVGQPNMVKEGDVYEVLEAAGVSCIAPFLRAGDIANRRTRTRDFVDKSWARPLPRALRQHHQYRLVLGVVGRPLTSFISSWEMVNAMGCALQGLCPHV
jgi:hypothetical protein